MAGARVFPHHRQAFGRFFETVGNRALTALGLGPEDLKRLKRREQEFTRRLQAVLTELAAEELDDHLIRTILGSDFIPPATAEDISGLPYEGSTLIRLARALPTPADDIFKPGRDLLVPGPPRPLSLLEIGELFPDYFDGGPDQWLRRDDFNVPTWFDRVEPGWLALRQEAVPDSPDKNYSNQKALLKPGETVPNVAELAWCLVLYRARYGRHLLLPVSLRTGSVTGGFNAIFIGSSNEGLVVGSRWAGFGFDWLGLAAVCKWGLPAE